MREKENRQEETMKDQDTEMTEEESLCQLRHFMCFSSDFSLLGFQQRFNSQATVWQRAQASSPTKCTNRMCNTMSCNKCFHLFCFVLFFTKIDELLMRLYSLYRRSPQKWRELRAIREALEELVVKPACSQGIRWIDHRRRAVFLSCHLKLQEHCDPRPGKTGRGHAREGEDQGRVAAVNLAKVRSQYGTVSGPLT